MSNNVKASLLTIGGGGAVNMFDHELGRAIRNCIDPNTDSSKKRKVILTVTLTPDAIRQNVAIEYVATTKLTPDFVGVDKMAITQKGKAFVSDNEQLFLEDIEPGVTPIEGAQEGNGSDDD